MRNWDIQLFIRRYEYGIESKHSLSDHRILSWRSDAYQPTTASTENEL